MASTSCQADAKQHSGTQPIDWPSELARHDRWLRTVVFARLGNAHEVDEVMQEVALAAVEQKAPLADPTKVAPWLYRTAVLQSLLYRRRRGRQRKLADRYATRAQSGNNRPVPADPLGWLLEKERARLIRHAVGRLIRRDAELLLLKYTEDWSYRQLAEHLGITASAVEARLHRARQKLRHELTLLQVIEAKP